MEAPFISICIPAYKNKDYLQRLLESIRNQSYSGFEVIISDDSPDDELKAICESYHDYFKLIYYKNDPALGMPQNWNHAIELATGEWIKIMHDDDWFTTAGALQEFADATNKDSLFIYSLYNNVFPDGSTSSMRNSKFRREQLLNEPMILLSQNIIGPPSSCMVHKSVKATYNPAFKWFVDIEYYMQCLSTTKNFYAIEKPIINFGVNSDQMTNRVKNDPAIEFFEAFKLLEIYGQNSLKNILVFDAWWRMCRNMKISSVEQLATYGRINASSIPEPIRQIVKQQQKSSEKKLKFGLYSKFMMWRTYKKI